MTANIDEIVMYIFVNMDLQMSKGKICAQSGHIVGKIVAEMVKKGYEEYPLSKAFIEYKKWENQCTKIILRATQLELDELRKHSNARAFIDSGDRLPDDSLTVVGFLPTTMSAMMNITENYKLL
jgi:peptidyl-tRNA hydrolase